MEILTLIPFILFAFILFKLKSSRSRRKSPPGPWKLPLIGNMHNLIGDLPHHIFHQLAQKYGPLMELRLGEVTTMVVSSADAAKEIMKTHDINFASRPSILAAEIISYNCTSIAFSPYGDYWRQLRKICTLELLSAKRVQSFSSLRHQVYSDVAKSIAYMEGSPLNLTNKLFSSTYLFTTTASLGKMTEKEKRLHPLIVEGIEMAAGFDIAELYPSVKLFQMMSRVKKRLTAIKEEADKILEDIIQQRKQEFAVKKKDDSQEDLLDVLLKFGPELSSTTDNIKAIILEMFSAGSDTSATVMDWAMVEMMKDPRVLKKAQDEVREVFDEQGYVDEAHIHELKYLKLVVKEILRLHPPLPLLLPRKSSETCEINGYEIPANTKIIVNAWAINRDPNYWNNGDCFEPERFVDGSVDFKGKNFEYIPFGAGRRICPGMTFGIANIELPLAMFLYHFDWKLPDGIKPQDIDMTERLGVTARRDNDLLLVPLIKRPLPIK